MNFKNISRWILISTHTAPTRGFGGPSVSFRNTINQLIDKGVRYDLLTTDPSRTFKKTNQLNREFFYKSFIFHKLGFSVNIFFHLLQKIKNHEVVFINGLTTFVNFSSLILCYFFKTKKVVLFPRGGLEDGRTDQWNFIKKFLFRVQIKIIKYLNKNKNIMIVFASESEMVKSTSNFNYKNTILPNINTFLFNPQLRLKNKRKYDLLYVGRYSPEKGIDRLFKILDVMSIKNSLSSCIIFDSISQTNLNFIRSKYENSNIKFMIGIKNQDVLKIMSESKYLFFPSYVENYGNVLVEAVSQGSIPIVFKDTHWSILIDKFSLDIDMILKKIKNNNLHWDKDLSKSVRNFVYKNYVKNNKLDLIINWINNEI